MSRRRAAGMLERDEPWIALRVLPAARSAAVWSKPAARYTRAKSSCTARSATASSMLSGVAGRRIAEY